jgi:hypothetical protein
MMWGGAMMRWVRRTVVARYAARERSNEKPLTCMLASIVVRLSGLTAGITKAGSFLRIRFSKSGRRL